MPHLYRNILAVAFGIALASPAANAADPLFARFQAPPKAARPVLRWWWPGGDVSDETLATELQAVDQAGFGGVEIQPFHSGLNGLGDEAVARVNDYATPAFFGHVAAAAKAAAHLGLSVDYTLGSGWPAGGGWDITPALSEHELRAAHVGLSGPSTFSGPIPAVDPTPFRIGFATPLPGQAIPADWEARLKAETHLVALIAVKGTAPQDKVRPSPPYLPFPAGTDTLTPGRIDPSTTIDLTARVKPDGTLDWQVPPGDWQLISFVSLASKAQVVAGVGAAPQLVADPFNAEATRTHAEHVLGAATNELRPFAGKTLQSVFVDSFELPVDQFWSADFLDQFKARRGYDLTPYLPFVLRHGWMNPYTPGSALPEFTDADTGARVEADYRRTVGELFEAGFIAPAAAWSHAHGYSFRLQAHGAPADMVEAYGTADIPETEDLYRGVTPDFFAVARSAADIYGKPRVSAESLIILGKATDATPADWKARADILFASGVNHIVAHGDAYPYPLPGHPQWLPFGTRFGSMLNPRNPVFAHLAPLTAYMARVQAVMQATRNVVPVVLYQDSLVLPPNPDPAHAQEDPVYAGLRHDGYLADDLTADGLLKSTVKARKMIAPSGQAYGAVIIRDQAALRPDTAQKLADLAAHGVPVIILGQTPDRGSGLKDAGDGDRAVRAAMASLTRHATADTLAGALHAADVAPNLTFASGARADFWEKSDGRRHLYFVSNPADTGQTLDLVLDRTGPVELWDPWTGKRVRSPAKAGHVHLDLAAHQSLFVVVE